MVKHDVAASVRPKNAYGSIEGPIVNSYVYLSIALNVDVGSVRVPPELSTVVVVPLSHVKETRFPKSG